MSNERLDELEIKVAHLEDYMKQLNEVVLNNARLLDSLKSGQTLLRKQLDELSDQLPSPEARRPPHY